MLITKNTIIEKLSNNKSIIQNFSYLSALQLINLLIPLATYPYLIRVIGKETFGTVVFAQAIVNYLVILVGFGFNISATRFVSIYRDDKKKLSEIVSSVFVLKSLLLVIAFIILSVLLFWIPRTRGYEILFFVSMWACVYEVIFPIWYYQGLEKMQYITFITLISRLIFVFLIFVLIHQSSDFLLIPAIYGIGAIVAGAVSLYFIFVRHNISFRWQKISTLRYYFIDSVPIFISSASASIYVNANKIITGTFLGMTEVAYYDLAEKITTLLKQPLSILNQSIFPKISKEKNIIFIKKIFKLSLLGNTILSTIAILMSKYIILFFGGRQMIDSQLTTCILATTVPVIAMNNIFAIQILIPFGYTRTFSKIIAGGAFFYFIQVTCLYLISCFSIINISIVTLFTEIFVTLAAYFYCKKYRIWH
ncbi:flippase [Paludibacter jiangxiensis]|uniref:Polysaccharide transporter, PST family n=1 Tax=Paludibacter jiangxiensis TaxID=681398 RepID=A0A170Z3T6_9BACT|nr:flippase [Paludibacter jiangxiensis]GAT62310.1 polysaccharide transporter, PST family [Paludibacter jiangxiensis]